VRAGFAAGLCAVVFGTTPAQALELSTSSDLDYSYSQINLGGDVNAATRFNQKYEIKYVTSLTTAYDFLGAVRVNIQDSWMTDHAATSQVAPTLELGTKGSQAAAKIIYETTINSTDAWHETADVRIYSTSLTFDLQMTPVIWPEVKLKFQRRSDFQDYQAETTGKILEFSTRKDIYGLRLDYNLKRESIDSVLPGRTGRTATTWSTKATYKEILWGGTEFELAYALNEAYTEERTRGFFADETASFSQILKTRLKNSLVIAPRMTLALAWEYQFEQDLLALVFDYKLTNKYVIDLRWDAFDWLKITGEARRETGLTSSLVGEDDERTMTDGLKAGFDFTSISWLRVSGKAEFRNDGKILADTGGSVDSIAEEKYELIAKNRFGEFWDFTVNASAANTHTDDWLTKRETRVKAELKLKLLDLVVTPGYEVRRTNEWERERDDPINQQQVRDAKIRFAYQMQLVELFKATFSHEYGIKIDDNLDEVLDFERLLQFNENTRLTILLAEFVRDLRVEGEIDRRASDTEGDPDPQLVELSYALKLDWKFQRLSVLSSIKYNDKGSTFDDVSFNAKVGWKGEQLEVTGEYQFDKILKDLTEPKDEKRKLSLKLNYRF